MICAWPSQSLRTHSWSRLSYCTRWQGYFLPSHNLLVWKVIHLFLFKPLDLSVPLDKRIWSQTLGLSCQFLLGICSKKAAILCTSTWTSRFSALVVLLPFVDFVQPSHSADWPSFLPAWVWILISSSFVLSRIKAPLMSTSYPFFFIPFYFITTVLSLESQIFHPFQKCHTMVVFASMQ